MAILATNYTFPGQTDVYRGETRDVYSLDTKMISVATDRLTIFGHLFSEPIPCKGQVINQLTQYFAEAAKDIVPSWIEYVPDSNVSIGKKCQPFKVNMVIRGALIGHAWRVYQAGARTISGIHLPDNMQEYDLFDEPIITPSTKAQSGYEEDISAQDIIEEGLMSEAEFERLSIVSRQLFIRGKQLVRKKGLILADTRYEFGTHDDQICIIDEIHTPDSSRYFKADSYEQYLRQRSTQPPEHLSTEYIRQWLLEQGYSGLEGQAAPALTKEFIDQLSGRYISLYQQITGDQFAYPDPDEDQLARIKHNIQLYFVDLAI